MRELREEVYNMKDTKEEVDKLLSRISAIISGYNNSELEVIDEENVEQVVLRLVKEAVEKYLYG